MIQYIKGILTGIGEQDIIVETGGIGYRILVSGGSASPFLSIGDEITVYTYLSVTQDALTLYGVFSEDALTLFKMLITVSGIGPKGALGILTALTPDMLRAAIAQGDAAAISAAPGIGKKTAQKVILELHDKVGTLAVPELYAEDMSAGAGADSGAVQEAVMALTALGYRGPEAAAAVRRAAKNGDADVETLLKLALKEL